MKKSNYYFFFFSIVKNRIKTCKTIRQLGFIFKNSNIFNSYSMFNNSLTIIYEQLQFLNAFQIHNLNRDIATMATSQFTLAHLATNHRGSEQTYALQQFRESSFFETAFQQPRQLVPLTFFLVCIFTKSKNCKENQILRQIIQNTGQIEFSKDSLYQNTVRIITVNRKQSKYHHSVIQSL